MKKKRFIPLLLAVSLSSSVLGFAAPTQEESVSEVSTSSSSLSEDFTSENEASLINNPEAEESADISTMGAAEDHSSGEDAQEEDGLYPSTDALFAFEDIQNEDEFYASFGEVLEPVKVPEYLGEEKYYRAVNPAVYGLDPQNPSRQILDIIAQALRKKTDRSNISDEEAYGGILPFREAGGNMTPVGIRFKKFDNMKNWPMSYGSLMAKVPKS